MAGGTPDEVRHKNAVLDEHCAAIERNPNEIRRSTQVQVRAPEEVATIRERIEPAKANAGTDPHDAFRILEYGPDISFIKRPDLKLFEPACFFIEPVKDINNINKCGPGNLVLLNAVVCPDVPAYKIGKAI